VQKKRRAKLPDMAVVALKEWLHVHRNHPYPTEREKAQLSEITTLTLNQVNNWFTNARRRILPREGAIARPHAVVVRATATTAANAVITELPSAASMIATTSEGTAVTVSGAARQLDVDLAALAAQL